MSLATQNGKAPAKKDFLTTLEASREGIAQLLPPHMSIDRVMRLARTAYLTTPAIQACSGRSIIESVMKACSLGLEPGGPRGHTWLIPYDGECTCQIGYKGILELAHRSKFFGAIEAVVVYQNDVFRVTRNPRPIIHHEICLTEDCGPMTHVYAYATINGEVVFEIMDVSTVDKIRRSSKCLNSPAWRNWYDQMACRSVLNRLLKRQPNSVELAEALEHCNSEFDHDGRQTITVKPGQSRAAALAASLSGQPALPEPEFTEGTLGTIRTEADEPEEVTPEDYGGREPGMEG